MQRLTNVFLSLVLLGIVWAGSVLKIPNTRLNYEEVDLLAATSASLSSVSQDDINPLGLNGEIILSSKTKNIHPADDGVSVMFVGDIMLSRHVGEQLAQKDDWDFHINQIRDTLNSADIVFANLETTVSDVGSDLGNLYSFRADERTIETLRNGNVAVVSVANNHIWDWGKEAFLDTLYNLQQNNTENDEGDVW